VSWLRRLVIAFERMAAAAERENELTEQTQLAASDAMGRAMQMLQSMQAAQMGPSGMPIGRVATLLEFPKAPGDE